MKYILLIFAATLIYSGCNGPGSSRSGNSQANVVDEQDVPVGPPGIRLAQGRWGGEHASLNIYKTAAIFEVDCAFGTVYGEITPDSNGNFRNEAVYIRERKPSHAPPPPRNPATVDGHVENDSMSIKISWNEDGENKSAKFTLVKGRAGRNAHCN